MQGGKATNCDTYRGTLTELRKRIKQQCGDNARPHSLKTREAVTKFGCTVLPQPHHGPDPAPSDVHLFGALTHAISDTKFGTVDMIRAVELK
jgi:hypothetical protein